MSRSLNGFKTLGISVLFAGSAVGGIAFSMLTTTAATAIMTEPTNPVTGLHASDSTDLGQVNTDPTPPFPDVPLDQWGYTAVERLAENYGCIVGYPDGTFRGDELLTRYEFAAAMAACLDASLENTRPPVSEVQEIQQDLQRQLDCLTGDVDRLEGNPTDASTPNAESCARF